MCGVLYGPAVREDTYHVITGGGVHDGDIVLHVIHFAGLVADQDPIRSAGNAGRDFITGLLGEHELFHLTAHGVGAELSVINAFEKLCTVPAGDAIGVEAVQDGCFTLKPVVFMGTAAVAMVVQILIDPVDSATEIILPEKSQQIVGVLVAAGADHGGEAGGYLGSALQGTVFDGLIDGRHDEQLHNARGAHGDVMDHELFAVHQIFGIDGPDSFIPADHVEKAPLQKFYPRIGLRKTQVLDAAECEQVAIMTVHCGGPSLREYVVPYFQGILRDDSGKGKVPAEGMTTQPQELSLAGFLFLTLSLFAQQRQQGLRIAGGRGGIRGSDRERIGLCCCILRAPF